MPDEAIDSDRGKVAAAATVAAIMGSFRSGGRTQHEMADGGARASGSPGTVRARVAGSATRLAGRVPTAESKDSGSALVYWMEWTARERLAVVAERERPMDASFCLRNHRAKDGGRLSGPAGETPRRCPSPTP